MRRSFLPPFACFSFPDGAGRPGPPVSGRPPGQPAYSPTRVAEPGAAASAAASTVPSAQPRRGDVQVLEFARNDRGTAARAAVKPAPAPGRVALAPALGPPASAAAAASVAPAVQTMTFFRELFTDSPLFTIYACMICQPLTKA